MKIYTKTGDKGTSSLYNGERREKDDEIFEALGTTDELTSHLGLALEYCEELKVDTVCKQIEQIQRHLQDIGSIVATPAHQDGSNETRAKRIEALARSLAGHAQELEQWIDAMTAELPQLTKFILPSGGKASAHLHVARTVCRRAERRVQPLLREALCDEDVGVYLNRLSDYLFTAARYAAMKQGKPEKVY